jgi:rRNA-processing protein FCF1
MAVNRCRYPEGIGKTVILDTNFLFIPLKFKVDIFSELQRLYGAMPNCIITSATQKELEYLKIGAKPSLLKEIRFAERLSQRCQIIDIDSEPNEKVDDLILRYAKETGYPVATNDAELRGKLRKRGLSLIYLRQKTHLVLE